SPACTGPQSGATRTSSSRLTTFFSDWTRSVPKGDVLGARRTRASVGAQSSAARRRVASARLMCVPRWLPRRPLGCDGLGLRRACGGTPPPARQDPPARPSGLCLGRRLGRVQALPFGLERLAFARELGVLAVTIPADRPDLPPLMRVMPRSAERHPQTDC